MQSDRLLIVHDVLGTLFSLDEPIRVLREHRPELTPREAHLIIFDWFHGTQRDFSTVSSHGAYKPIGEIFQATLPRILQQADVRPDDEEPRKDAERGALNRHPTLSAAIFGTLKKLSPRPGMVDAFTKVYRDPALVPERIKTVDVVGATNGSRALTKAFFEGALGSDVKLELTPGNGSSNKGSGIGVFSCDDDKVAKPVPEVYVSIKKAFGVEAGKGSKNEKIKGMWFVASHNWDLFAARNAG